MGDKLKSIKTGRATNDIFDDLEVKAYGEMQCFQDLCQTVVRGQQLLTVKVFDEGVKDEVLKALNRADMDIEVQMEGKDIKVKLGLGKKDHKEKALKQIKDIHDNAKIAIRQVRQDLKPTISKLQKIAGKDEVKQFEDQVDKQIKAAEKGG